MGRRKSKRTAGPKRKNLEALDVLFNCPFCNHERSCEVKMEKTKNTGRIQCNICLEDFQLDPILGAEPTNRFNSNVSPEKVADQGEAE
eukprot:TCALIF_11710-PA protein Name:"Similar to CG40228 Transcription elongation factor 1 homolog (Drosophila melanogaster)" AED:0.17 eAED:0.17 QI:0/0/0/0.5/1/1/2/0/87